MHAKWEETLVKSQWTSDRFGRGLALFGAAVSSSLLAIGSPSAQELTFGYVPASLEYPYNVATARGFERAAAAAGVATVVLDPRGSVERQGNAIDDLIAQGVDAIGFLPLDSVVAETFADKVSEAGLPVVAVATMVGNSEQRRIEDPYPSLNALVVTDNNRAGQVAGELAASVLPKDRPVKIAIVDGDPAYTIVRMYNEAFSSALNEAGVQFEIVAEQPTNWTPDQGEAVCQNFLTAHPDLDLIFSQADDMAIGCARAIEAVQSEVTLVATGGGSKLGHDAILAGEMYGSVCTRPELLGELMFEAMYTAVTKPETPKARYITYEMPPITRDTIEDCPEQW